METTVKHFVFSVPDWEFENGDRRGRFAIALVGDDGVVVVRLAGPAPRVGHVMAAVRTWPALREFCNSAAAVRRHPYVVTCRTGISGSHDYTLREVRDAALADYPTRALLHVSDYGGVNRGIGTARRPMKAADFLALMCFAVPGERARDGECPIVEVEPLRFGSKNITPPGVVMFGGSEDGDGDFTVDSPTS